LEGKRVLKVYFREKDPQEKRVKNITRGSREVSIRELELKKREEKQARRKERRGEKKVGD